MGEGAISSRGAIAFLLRQAGPARLISLGLLMLAASMTEGIGLLMLVPITQLVVREGGDAPLSDWLDPLVQVPLGWLLLGLVALVSLRALIVYAGNESRRALDLGLARKLRRMLHQAILDADWRWLSRQNSADQASLIMHEADRVSGLTDQALSILTAGVTLVVLVASAALISWEMTLAVAILGILGAMGMTVLRGRYAHEGELYGRATADFQRAASNGLQHLRAARIAGAEEELARDFAEAADRLVELQSRFFRAGHRTLMLFQIGAVFLLAGLVFVALRVFSLPLAAFLPVIVIIARIVPLVGNIQQGLRGWHYNLPALASVMATVQEARQHREAPDHGVQAIDLAHSLELRGVTLTYAGRERPVVEGFGLELGVGSILAISGPSGSGKSSLADILAGLIAPDSGMVLIDGQALDSGLRSAWRRNVAYVEQEPFLFDGTVAENLAWGHGSAGEHELWAALEAASGEFVRQLPQGLQTQIGEGGRELSGGEKQRIALARALLGEPQLLILDEVSAGLDRENTGAIIRSIAPMRGKRTVVILSHDPQLIELADRVVVLDKAGNGR